MGSNRQWRGARQPWLEISNYTVYPKGRIGWARFTGSQEYVPTMLLSVAKEPCRILQGDMKVSIVDSAVWASLILRTAAGFMAMRQAAQ